MQDQVRGFTGFFGPVSPVETVAHKATLAERIADCHDAANAPSVREPVNEFGRIWTVLLVVIPSPPLASPPARSPSYCHDLLIAHPYAVVLKWPHFPRPGESHFGHRVM